jgi:hypothetical protein
LIQKKQKIKSAERLLTAQSNAANQAKPGLEKFAAIVRALANALQKFPMPCYYAQGHHRFA